MNRSFTSFLFIIAAVHCCLFWGTGTDAAGPKQCYDKSGEKGGKKNRSCAFIANGKMFLCDSKKWAKKHCPVLCDTCTCKDSTKQNVVKVDGEKRPCSYLQSLDDTKFERLCSKYAIGSKCPKTCDTCHDGCQDNPNKFKVNNNIGKKSCSDATPALCKNKKFKRNCKKECGVCVIISTPAPSPAPSPGSTTASPTLPPTPASNAPTPSPTPLPTPSPTPLPTTDTPVSSPSPAPIDDSPTSSPTTKAPTQAPSPASTACADKAAGVYTGAGGDVTFVTCNDGTLRAAGKNSSGQLGIGTTSNSEPNPQVNNDLRNTDDSQTSSYHTCSILNDKRLFCMGRNSNGQLGNGSTEWIVNTPQQVTGFNGADSDVTSVCTGSQHTCAIAGGKLWCWGKNAYGVIGVGDNGETVYTSPVQVDLSNFPNNPTPLSVYSASYHICAMFSDNKIRCWGANMWGQLGLSGVEKSTVPIEVVFPEEQFGSSTFPRAVSCGFTSTCALLSDGTVSCWGLNAHGALGIGNNFNVPYKTPQKTLVLENVVSIHNGGNHCCALLPAGELWCWGLNESGALGLGDTTSRHTPTKLPAIADGDVVSVTAASRHTCVLVSNGTVWCFGSNNNGQLALGNTGSFQTSPTKTLFTA